MHDPKSSKHVSEMKKRLMKLNTVGTITLDEGEYAIRRRSMGTTSQKKKNHPSPQVTHKKHWISHISRQGTSAEKISNYLWDKINNWKTQKLKGKNKMQICMQMNLHGHLVLKNQAQLWDTILTPDQNSIPIRKTATQGKVWERHKTQSRHQDLVHLVKNKTTKAVQKNSAHFLK